MREGQENYKQMRKATVQKLVFNLVQAGIRSPIDLRFDLGKTNKPSYIYIQLIKRPKQYNCLKSLNRAQGLNPLILTLNTVYTVYIF